MKKYVSFGIVLVALIGLLCAVFDARKEYSHIVNATHLQSAGSVYIDLLFPKVASVLTMLLIILGAKNLLVGESANSVATTSAYPKKISSKQLLTLYIA